MACSPHLIFFKILYQIDSQHYNHPFISASECLLVEKNSLLCLKYQYVKDQGGQYKIALTFAILRGRYFHLHFKVSKSNWK